MSEHRICIKCGRGTSTPILQRWCILCYREFPPTLWDKAGLELYRKIILLDHIPGARYEVKLRHVTPINKMYA